MPLQSTGALQLLQNVLLVLIPKKVAYPAGERVACVRHDSPRALRRQLQRDVDAPGVVGVALESVSDPEVLRKSIERTTVKSAWAYLSDLHLLQETWQFAPESVGAR